ncbi:hypothetical protein ABT294_23395 [Nonomuraea sp. NPDC000554]|uniref:hypothetical protein n=1 Tax=Nonomuraea sp. NPDC000554 TaxID=3154259 RepID=UPI00331B8465
MTHPLTGQRPRAELIAELYDRHAAGLFAYCADQLGDPGSAADVLVAVLAAVPAAPPPRAGLYAYARREILRRDVVYAPPRVDPLVDPASALVERALRELRPHHREVLLLGEVCGLDRAELAWVLGVASDTAEELATGATRRYRQVLDSSLAAVIGVRMAKPVADVYGALGVAPLRDVLGRLSWPTPPATLRARFADPRPTQGRVAPMFVKPLWPGPPTWPLPPVGTDPATATGIFPTDLLAPPAPSRTPAHEATTAPMPKLPSAPTPSLFRPATRSATDSAPFGAPASPPQTHFAPFGAPASPPATDFAPFGAPASPPQTDFAPWGALAAPAGGPTLAAPLPADVLDDEPVTQPQPAIGDVLAPQASPGEASLFTPRPRQSEPVYRMPLPAEEPEPEPELEPEPVLGAELRPGPNRARVVRKGPAKRWREERHHDWAWEVAGFLVCVAIAMIVFFTVPIH